jgi:predicted RNA methylase
VSRLYTESTHLDLRRPPDISSAPPAGADAVDERLGSDVAFDGAYERRIRALSSQHWTPVAIAARAARLLTRAGATRILDVGSGAGKFCIVGALSTRATFVGVERRADLVEVAGRAAREMGAARATFIHANVEALPFDGFDGFYLYNPFFEHISRHLPLVDRTLERSGRAHRRVVRSIEEKLGALPAPAVVVTYHGFGGQLPPDFSHVGDEPAGNDRLELWIKRP